MKKFYLLLCILLPACLFSQTPVTASRMNEVFLKTNLSASGLTTPWEITYGPDNFLWITDAKAYKVYRMDPVSGTKTLILDLSETGGFTPAGFKRSFTSSQNPWPQGGLAGLAIHPDFMNSSTPKKYVYISYVRSFDSTSVLTNGGSFFTNRVVRFTYNTISGQLDSPVSLCDTLPGSVDHNSQRMIIAPVNGVPYLFYASGDMGAGQLASRARVNHAQQVSSYQGKILRFNLEPDADPGLLDQWIPDDNPFNGAGQSAVWCTGIRNNQGFAYDSVRNILYGSSHGPYSDDEVNIIEPGRNYGHPIVVGYAADENYMGSSAGSYTGSSLSPITSEAANAASIGTSYKDPLFAGYAVPQATVNNIWTTNPGNGGWPSEAWSGLGLYNYSLIPGWKNSLLMAGLKWGRVIRTKLSNTGTAIAQTGGQDTVCYFDGLPRYRDMAFGPNGKDIYITTDNSNSTVAPLAPSVNNPALVSCLGCVQKFTFLGYNTVGGTSAISPFVPIAAGKPNTCEDANTININAANAGYWVPITDTLGNIVAEINANNNILGDVTTSIFVNSATVREQPVTHTLYLDRNITITPQIQPSTPVSIRLYLTNAEFMALTTATNSLTQPSGVVVPVDLAIFKNADVCGAAIASDAVKFVTTHQAAFGTGGYVVQTSIPSFSTFYIAGVTSLLPVRLLSFTGSLSAGIAQLKWMTDNEKDTKTFILERSVNNKDFFSLGQVGASTNMGQQAYQFADSAIGGLASTVVYYRLKIISNDDATSYSGTVSVYPAPARDKLFIRPNPAFDKVSIELNAGVAEQANWELTDMTGKTVLQHAVQLNKGKNTITINIIGVAAGMYYIKFSGNNISQAATLQKL